MSRSLSNGPDVASELSNLFSVLFTFIVYDLRQLGDAKQFGVELFSNTCLQVINHMKK
jgi:hypothetical protein